MALILISLGISMIQSVRDDEKGGMPMTSFFSWFASSSGNLGAGMAATLLLGVGSVGTPLGAR